MKPFDYGKLTVEIEGNDVKQVTREGGWPKDRAGTNVFNLKHMIKLIVVF